MGRLLFRLLAVVTLCFAAASCASMRPRDDMRPPLYDVRDVAVLAGARISHGLIRGVDARVSDAIASTHRSQPLPHVVLAVKIDRVVRGVGEGRDRNEAFVTVEATAVDNGEVVATGSFRVISYTMSTPMADEGLAEEIAARVRFTFGLTTPSVPKVRRMPVQPAGNDIQTDVSSDQQPDFVLPAVDDAAVTPEKADPAAVTVDSKPARSDIEAGAKTTISLTPVVQPTAVTAKTPATLSDGQQPCVAAAGTTCTPAAQ